MHLAMVRPLSPRRRRCRQKAAAVKAVPGQSGACQGSRGKPVPAKAVRHAAVKPRLRPSLLRKAATTRRRRWAQSTCQSHQEGLNRSKNRRRRRKPLRPKSTAKPPGVPNPRHPESLAAVKVHPPGTMMPSWTLRTRHPRQRLPKGRPGSSQRSVEQSRRKPSACKSGKTNESAYSPRSLPIIQFLRPCS